MRKMTSTLLAMIGISIATASYAETPVIGAIEKYEDIRDCVAEEDMWGAEELNITNVTIENNSNVYAYSPRTRITGTSRVERGSTFRAGVPVFKVHFVNMVDPATATPPIDVIPGIGIDFSERPEPDPPVPGSWMTQEEFNDFCLNEIEILNYYFKSDDGRQLVKFEMKSALLWNTDMAGTYRDVTSTNFYKCTSEGSNQECDPAVYDGKTIDAFNDNDFSYFRDSNVINVVFFDNPNSAVSAANPNLDVHGSGDPGPPMVIIDYKRVDGNLGHDCDSDGIIDDCGINPYGDGNLYVGSRNNGVQDDHHNRRGVEPHEMGHVFGLRHVCRDHPYDSSDLWDNLMWGGLTGGSLKVTGFDECCEDIPRPVCQEWYRTSFFAKDPISRADGGYKYVQSYNENLVYTGGFENYGQAEIIMNMAFHFRGYLE